jgi:hypothetical protein
VSQHGRAKIPDSVGHQPTVSSAVAAAATAGLSWNVVARVSSATASVPCRDNAVRRSAPPTMRASRNSRLAVEPVQRRLLQQ